MKDLTKEQVGFTRGVVYSIAQLLRHGAKTYAEYLWEESGFSELDLSLCDEYDVSELREKGVGGDPCKKATE